MSVEVDGETVFEKETEIKVEAERVGEKEEKKGVLLLRGNDAEGENYDCANHYFYLAIYDASEHLLGRIAYYPETKHLEIRKWNDILKVETI